MSDDQLMRLVYLVCVLLLVLPMVLPLAGRQRHLVRQAAIWLLVGAGLFAGYQLLRWAAG